MSAISEIHASYARNFIGAFRRNEKYWREWIFKDARFKTKARHLAVVRSKASDNAIVGYCMYEKATPPSAVDLTDEEKAEQKTVSRLTEFGVAKSIMDADGGASVFAEVADFVLKHCESVRFLCECLKSHVKLSSFA